MAVSERQGEADVEEGDVTAKKALLTGTSESRPTVTPMWAERDGEEEEGMDTGSHKEEAITYENQGFEEDKERASVGERSPALTGGHPSREHEGAVGETAGAAPPEPTHDVRMLAVFVGDVSVSVF